MQSVAFLESVLRARKLDHTITSTRHPPVLEPGSETGIPLLDERLGGGLPRGELSQLVGPRSSGRTSLMTTMLASATARGEMVALVDALDMFDPVTGADAGLDLTQLVWVRGCACEPSEMPRVLSRAIKAMGLVLHARGFGCVVLDLADSSPHAVQCLPFTTWLRLGRALEGTRTVGLVVGGHPIARSARGRTITLHAQTAGGYWAGTSERSRLFETLDIEARVDRKAF